MISRFIASKKPLEIVEGSVPSKTTLGVVDASFNPPHFAHRHLAEILRRSVPQSCIVLMLATGNADKPSAPPEQLEHRLDMMKLVLKSIDGPKCIALTSEPYFVTKATALHNLYPAPQIFAMGSDTVMRLFDPKYYTEPVDDVMQRLFEFADIIVLTRNEVRMDTSKYTQWGDKIQIWESDDSTLGVSSTEVRKAAMKSDWNEVERLAGGRITEYIKTHGISALSW